MRTLIFLLLALVPAQVSFSQSFHPVDKGNNIDKKFTDALRYHEYEIADSASADYSIEVFFVGAYSIGKGYSGYYKLYDNTGLEVYKSKEYKAGSFGALAENYMVKRFIKDLPKALKSTVAK